VANNLPSGEQPSRVDGSWDPRTPDKLASENIDIENYSRPASDKGSSYASPCSGGASDREVKLFWGQARYPDADPPESSRQPITLAKGLRELSPVKAACPMCLVDVRRDRRIRSDRRDPFVGRGSRKRRFFARITQ